MYGVTPYLKKIWLLLPRQIHVVSKSFLMWESCVKWKKVESVCGHKLKKAQ